MKPESGYYSIVQYCPSPERGEGVNVGVLLFSPAHQFIRTQFTKDFTRPKRLFAKDGLFDREELKSSLRTMEERISHDAPAFRSLADLEAFIGSRASDLRLTTPRAIKVFEPQRDLVELFEEVIGGLIAKQSSPRPFPQLSDVFSKLQRDGRACLNVQVTIPVLDRPIRIPYAYQNGVQNLVLPHRFSANEKNAIESASLLAIKGDLLHRHQAESGPRRLIVASEFEAGSASAIELRVSRTFQEYGVEMVTPSGVDAFIERVRRDAHAA
jgi:hypothetical protein